MDIEEKSHSYIDNAEFWRLRHNSNAFDKEINDNIPSMVNDYDSLSSDDSLKNLFIKKSKENNEFIVNNENKINTQRIIDTIELISDDHDECNSKTSAKVEKIVELTNDSNQFTNNAKAEKLRDVTIAGSDLSSSDESMPSNADDLLSKISTDLKQLKVNINEIDSSTGFGDLIDFSDIDGSESVHHSQVQCNEMGESMTSFLFHLIFFRNDKVFLMIQ